MIDTKSVIFEEIIETVEATRHLVHYIGQHTCIGAANWSEIAWQISVGSCNGSWNVRNIKNYIGNECATCNIQSRFTSRTTSQLVGRTGCMIVWAMCRAKDRLAWLTEQQDNKDLYQFFEKYMSLKSLWWWVNELTIIVFHNLQSLYDYQSIYSVIINHNLSILVL